MPHHHIGRIDKGCTVSTEMLAAPCNREDVFRSLGEDERESEYECGGDEGHKAIEARSPHQR
jgi:hypothetical protein